MKNKGIAILNKGIAILPVLIVVMISFLVSYSRSQAAPDVVNGYHAQLLDTPTPTPTPTPWNTPPPWSVIYVDIDATGANNGTSWGDAYLDLQSALTVAAPGDEIWVAEGEYKPDSGSDRSATFQLLNNVALFGGFSGTETSLGERDWVANLTILSGDIGTEGLADDNSYHVVTGSDTDSSAVLDGFTITAGNASGGTDPDNHGGGMYNDSGSPTLANLTFSGNSADYGGGMVNDNSSSPTLTHVTFDANTAAYNSGGMENKNSSNPTLTHVTFLDNTAVDGLGGGIFNVFSNFTLTDVTFSNNNASSGGGGGMYNLGGSITLADVTFSGNSAGFGGGISNDAGNTTLTNVTFSGNTANDDGGGMYNRGDATLTHVSFTGNTASVRGGGMLIWHLSNPTLEDVTFSDNSAFNGGGMYIDDNSNPTLEDVTFSGNSAVNSGGGVYIIDNSSPTLTNVTFSSNSAEDRGGGINHHSGTLTVTNGTFSGNSAFIGGGINNRDTGTLSVIDSIFSGNSTYMGGGISNDGTLMVTNSTFSGNSGSEHGGGIYNNSTGTLMVTNSTFSGNSADWDGGGIYSWGLGTVTVTNSTFSGNSAMSLGRGGGGIYSGGPLTVKNSTFSGNSANVGGGGIYNAALGTLDLVNTILADSTAGVDCSNDGMMGTDVNNLIEENSGCGTPISSADPGLGPLQDNGGPTHTMAIDHTSPAFDTGDDTLCPTTDQRGVTRPQGVACDIGAFEFEYAPSAAPTIKKVFGTDPIAVGGTSTITLTITNPNLVALTGAGVTDTYPMAIYNDTLANGSTTCAGGVVTAVIGGGSVALSGGTVPASGSCMVTVDVTSTTPGTYANTTGVVTTNEAPASGTASDTLTVTAVPPTVAKVFAPDTIAAGGSSTLTITLGNTNVVAATLSANLDDDLPAGVTAQAVNGATTCPGAVDISTNTRIRYPSGAVIPTGGCDIAVDVTSSTPGTVTNTIGVGDLQTDLGNNAAAASDDLTVTILALTVNSLNDPGDGICDPTDCTLREAIASLAAGGTIDFDPGLSAGTITLGSTLTIDKDLTIDGTSLASHVIISGNNSVRVFFVDSGVTAALQGLDIVDGYEAPLTGEEGAGIFNEGTLTLSNCTFSSNYAPDGGGSIANWGTLTVANCTFSDSIGYVGGGILNVGELNVTDSTFSGNRAYQDGGGIYNYENTMTVTNSTFSSNSADSGFGGAIGNTGNLTVTNSTFSGNIASSYGGGIGNHPDSSLTVTNSTFSGNSAMQGGGIYNWEDGTLNLVNTILADSTAGQDCVNIGIIDENYILSNLIEDHTDCGPESTPGPSGDPGLGPLQDNGGPTHTMAIDPASPAFNAGALTHCPATDQRSVFRPQGLACDIGAFEFEYSSSAALTVNSLNDPGDGICNSTECTLREAIASLTAGGTIDFDAGLSGGTITLASTLTIRDLTIDGSSLASHVRISGGDNVDVFQVYYYVTATLQGLDIVHELGSGGGGITNYGILTVIDSTISGNSASFSGGGISNWYVLTVIDSTISSNYAVDEGGGILNYGVLTVTNSTFSGNSTSYGGGILNRNTLTVTNSTFSGNSADFGGGIGNDAGNTTLTNVTFSGNSATDSGGGIYHYSGTLAVIDSIFWGNSANGGGGGILNHDTLTLTGSTFSGNSATNNGGAIMDFGTLTVTNSTFSGNSAANNGGGIYNYSGALTVTNSTFSGNSVNVGGGGIYNAALGTLDLVNTILADSPAGGDCNNAGMMGTDVNNLIEANDGCGTPVSTADPLLGSLQDNGGPTYTMAIDYTSPAFNAGDNGLCPATDQRGMPRPGGSACDIGAYEDQSPNLSPLASNDSATKIDDNPVTIVVLANDSDPEGDPLSVESVSDPANGSVAINPDDTLTYTPDPGFTGSDAFTYTVSDGFGGSATAIVTVFNVTDIGLVTGWTAGRAINNAGQVLGYFTTDCSVGGIPCWKAHLGIWSPTGGMQDLGEYTYGVYFGLNEQGHVAGIDWMWTDGVFQELGTLGGSSTAAMALNDQGQVVGKSETPSGWHAFLWTLAGGMQDIGTLGGLESEAWGVNNLGQVVGMSMNGSGEQRAFLWPAADGLQDLGTLGGSEGQATDINDLGQVVGGASLPTGESHAFLWTESDGMQDLGTLGGSGSGAMDINELGQVIGVSETASGDIHAFLWTPSDGMQDLGTLGGSESNAWAINDLGQIVGNSSTEVGGQSAALWSFTNQAPIAVDDSATMLKDTAVTIDVLALLTNDVDLDGDTLTLTTFSQPAFGSVADNSDDTLTYTPLPDFYGSDSFTYSVSDGKGGIGIATVALVPAIRNDTWTRAYELQLSSSEAIKQVLERPYQSRWFRFDVMPGSEILVTLSDLPANYDLTLYTDIAASYQELFSTEDLLLLSAEFAPDMFSPDMFSPDMFSPDMFSPDMFSPDMFSPDMFSPDMFSPDMFSPDMFSPDMFSPDMFSPDMFSPDMFSPDMFSPDMFSPDMFSPDMFSPDMFSPDPATFASAQLRSMIAVSASEGTVDEGVRVNSWNNSGEFYVRVSGNHGVYDPDELFHLEVTVHAGACEGVDPTLPPSNTAGVSGNFKAIVITDMARMAGTAEEKADLETSIEAFIERSEVAGVWVDMVSDARVSAANDLANSHPECPYAKNLVADAIKGIIASYRDVGNPLAYIVIIGNDDVIPFFRYPDNALLANEMNYSPPVLDTSASQASLKLGYVLGQDEYGSQINLVQAGSILPLPDLAVGRLVETPTEIIHMFDVYALTQDGVLNPSIALVSGYDFLADAATAIESELRAGLGDQNPDAVQSLITDRAIAPLDVCLSGTTFEGQCSWTADQMWTSLLDSRHDIIFLAGHFTASSWLASDNETRLLTSELETAGVDLENALIFSAGCHSGYNIVNEHNVLGVTREPDWAQAFARQGATFIGGTGYQYGDTDFVEYSERLYLEFSRQLRVGTGPISIGNALVVAKQTYLADTALMTGIHEKSLLQATLFGLPMLSIDLPYGRTTPEADSSIVSDTLVFQSDPGNTLGLRYADVVLTPTPEPLTMESVALNNPPTYTASYLAGNDGVVSNPAQPVLPLEMYNVSVDDNVLRGIGFRGGSFIDLENVLPLTGAPATEIRGVHTPFFTDYFFPVRPWNINYIGALTESQGEITRLAVLPAQYKSSSYASMTGTLRQFETLDFRLYYSANTTAYTDEESGVVFVPAQAAPPKIADISAAYDSQDSSIKFQATVVGDPTAGIQEVWIVYTIAGDPPNGAWQPVDLIQNEEDSRIWTGSLSLQSGIYPSAVRYMVQAVNGVGLVSYATNLGAYFTPGIDPGAPPPETQEPTELTLEAPPADGAYGESITVGATLTSNGIAVSDEIVVFGLGAQSRLAVTDSQGYAEATFLLLGLTGDATLSVSLPGSEDFASSADSSSITITKQDTQLSITPEDSEAILGEEALFTATLMDAGERRLPGKTVLFEVREEGSGDLVYSEAIETDFTGQAKLILPAQPIGHYALSAQFGGASLDDPRYFASSTEETLNVIFDFSGFFQPVENPPTLNEVKAGQGIPIKFSLNGDQGLEILDGSPFVHGIICDSGGLTNDLTETVTAGASILSYNTNIDQYIYVWKTDKLWAGTCLQLIVRLVDGTEHIATFKYR